LSPESFLDAPSLDLRAMAGVRLLRRTVVDEAPEANAKAASTGVPIAQTQRVRRKYRMMWPLWGP